MEKQDLINVASGTVEDDRAFINRSRDYLPNEVHYTSYLSPDEYRYLAPFLGPDFSLEKQDVFNLEALYFMRIREAAREVELLRLENADLHSTIRDLNNYSAHLQCLLGQAAQKVYVPGGEMAEVYNRSRDYLPNEVHYTSVFSPDEYRYLAPFLEPRFSKQDVFHRDALYFTRLREAAREVESLRLKNADLCSTIRDLNNYSAHLQCLLGQAAQKVYVPGGEMKEEAVELEAYKQGMCKTQLCNKWQGTCECPYGVHCQFAHGIEELRPVICDHRYKTELCKTVRTGDMCRYGHRCHFRHV